ncbi:hypothetical protein BDW02DRAFT_606538 [Decorospora gaudefroyi]|uniref:Uncharacterized protein n=1 Tax=Decorospora gaudefroyi TaxID=184978 RepID=A0A6A5KAI5_9PLEO|nr:hypothetical protein BDW02DRAFT_606538 [Decorospora gaudefroyi]
MPSQALLSFDEFRAQAKRFKPVPKYNVATESKDPRPWWDLDLDAFHANLKEITRIVTSCTKGATGLDRELDHVMKTATTLEQVERTSAVKVALIGAQGAGKSLLINALFDCTGLSLTGAKGFACTSAIQDEIDRKQKKTAEDFFDTIFGSREEFLNAWSSNPVNTSESKSLCQLKCKEAMQTHDMNSQGIAMFSRNTPQELLEDNKPFLSNVEDQVCLWPIVDCVTIRLNHPLLHQGLEIIDLPGSGDINMSRARHADAIKDTVDMEIVLGDTVRIGTDEMVISTARAGVINHGVSKVKVVATKIDVISDDQLAQCVGAVYDEINLLMQKADEDAATAEDEDDATKQMQINRCKLYLGRFKKSHMIKERAALISEKLGTTLSQDGPVDILHTSTSDYMTWIKTDKISFERQPALSPEDIGVPTIRRFLFNLPASQNLRDHVIHINTTVPAFVEKMKRVVTQSDRDAGFRTIADALDDLRGRYLGDLMKALNRIYAVESKTSIDKIEKDSNAYKEASRARIRNRWPTLKHAAFTRLLKSRGTVPVGTSKAKGLKKNVNWDLELAIIMKPGFLKWYATQTAFLKKLKEALLPWLDTLYHDRVALMNESAANLITVEKAKLKLAPLQHRMKSKVIAMMDEMMAEEKRLLHRATMEDERENNIVSAVTDEIYDDVFAATPELRTTFKKERLDAHFLSPEAHFVDRFITLFKNQLEEKMTGLIEKHLGRLNAMLEEFSKLMRDHAPVDYAISPTGERVREELEKDIGYIEDKAETLRGLLPKTPKDEDDASTNTDDYLEDSGDQVKDLNYFLDKVSKSKRKPDHATRGPAKRIKHEDV